MDSARIITMLACAALAFAGTVFTQVPEDARDPNGTAIPYPFVHLVHTTDRRQLGGTASLRNSDPFLFYQLGRDLLQRQFSLAQGAYGRSGELSVPLYRGANPGLTDRSATARFARDHVNSCGLCHSIPYREPGAGQTIASTSGTGRNTPHFFGAGVIEMLGEQIRQQLLNAYDVNRNGVFDRDEITSTRPARIRPTPGAPTVDYGNLQPDEHGVPQLNPVFRIWYLDASGRTVPDASGMNDRRVAAFNLAMQPFGWGRGYRFSGAAKVAEGGEASTLRSFYTAAADVHMGLQACDMVQQKGALTFASKNPVPGGLAGVSPNGAQQFDFGDAPDLGLKKTGTGVSLDDPDGDGHVSELTEGDVDAAEFYMFHAPQPAVRSTIESERGRIVLRQVGCTRCHIESWKIEARNRTTGFSGDRRLFYLATICRPDQAGVPQIRGKLIRLYRRNADGSIAPLYQSSLVERIYSDFKHWDIGPEFFERRFDGTLQREHRTPPLWGVGSTAPYGHAGQFQTLNDVISAHQGQALPEANAYRNLPAEKKRLLLLYLKSLVLYSTDGIEADIDGDGVISQHYMVRNQPVGYERFDARFLFRTLPLYNVFREVMDPLGRSVPLAFITNIRAAYGLDLPWRRDSDGDSYPDIIDPEPNHTGVERSNSKSGN